jgi:cytochrome d ubiquinol oxidase subunit II
MFELWYGIVAAMFVAYVVLDGFDLGAAALHFTVARTDAERRTVLAAIGPFWDANEVWLIAGGGALFAAFPRVLAAGLSGFYLAIFLVIWCLILRAIGIELRSHLAEPMWRSFWDAVLMLASALLPVLFGAALGNVIRGVPLTSDGWFQLTLFTRFVPREPVGILDWYTVLAGVFALIALTGHGAAFLAWRTTGPVHERSARLVTRLYGTLIVLWPLATLATLDVRPALFAGLAHRPIAWIALALAIGGFANVFLASRRGRWRSAFLGSCAFLSGMLIATAACLFPALLPSIGDPRLSLTAMNSGQSVSGLRVALGWWVIGAPLAVFYFVMLFRLNRGKVKAAEGREGY